MKQIKKYCQSNSIFFENNILEIKTTNYLNRFLELLSNGIALIIGLMGALIMMFYFKNLNYQSWIILLVVVLFNALFIIRMLMNSRVFIYKIRISSDNVFISYYWYNSKQKDICLKINDINTELVCSNSIWSIKHICFYFSGSCLLKQYEIGEWDINLMKKVKEKIEFEKKQLMA